jgi:hypothetical protein
MKVSGQIHAPVVLPINKSPPVFNGQEEEYRVFK